jgi:hypothetical protein
MMHLACQMKIRTDDRLGTLVLCGRPDASLVRVSCPRVGHVENVVMCRKCMFAITYCQFCFDQDKMLVRATRLALAV